MRSASALRQWPTVSWSGCGSTTSGGKAAGASGLAAGQLKEANPG